MFPNASSSLSFRGSTFQEQPYWARSGTKLSRFDLKNSTKSQERYDGERSGFSSVVAEASAVAQTIRSTMISCVLITKTDGSIIYSAHYGGNQSLSTVQETEATIYRLTNQNWNHAKGGNFDVAHAEYGSSFCSIWSVAAFIER